MDPSNQSGSSSPPTAGDRPANFQPSRDSQHEEQIHETPPNFNAQQEVENLRNELFKNAMNGDWNAVVQKYKDEPRSRLEKITRSKETALHIAISDHRINVAMDLLKEVTAEELKKMTTERKNNPLHFAAELGLAELCEEMVKMNEKKDEDKEGVVTAERVKMEKKDEDKEDVVTARNEAGETPLFLAALHGKKEAFYALHSKCEHTELYHLYDVAACKRNNDGNTILHVAILGEYFDLAFQILNWYPDLTILRNVKGQSPLQLLANNPSAFRSGCHFGPVNDFIYTCTIVEPLKVEPPSDIKPKHVSKFTSKLPKNYETLAEFLSLSGDVLSRFVFHPPWTSWWGEEAGDIENPQSKPKKQQSADQTTNASNKKSCKLSHLDVKGGKKKVQKDGSQDGKTMEKEKGGRRQAEGLPFPLNYLAFFLFLEFAMELLFFILGLGFFRVRKIKEKKRKHSWAQQVMKELVKNGTGDYEYEDTGARPTEESLQDIISGYKDTGATPTDKLRQEMTSVPPDSGPIESRTGSGQDNTQKPMGKSNIETIEQILSGGKVLRVEIENPRPDVYDLEMETIESEKGKKEKSPILLAAKMGVTEIVEEILNKYPVAIQDVNEEKKNVVLLAVENRHPNVYTFLQKKYPEKESIFQKLDNEGNSALHLAATLGKNRPWLIPGAALQMQWEMKWYKFIKESMPRHFFTRLNMNGQTPREVFTETHRDLVKDGGTWLTNTSQSCSVVAALIATVAYASATTVPGGVKQDIGLPALQGKTAFNIFTISSLVALCFSVTSLTMFLSILTSRYQALDFLHSLPAKLIVGLTSLFVSIASMLVSFCAGHFFDLADPLKRTAFPIYIVTCLPISLFAFAQFPLFFDVIKSTITTIPKRSYEVTSL